MAVIGKNFAILESGRSSSQELFLGSSGVYSHHVPAAAANQRRVQNQWFWSYFTASAARVWSMRHRGFNPNTGVRHLSEQDSVSGAANDQLTTSAGNLLPTTKIPSRGARGRCCAGYQLIEKLAHQNRERIPERPVHAKGWGAYGTLTISGDISMYTKQIAATWRSTPLILRFLRSPVNSVRPMRAGRARLRDQVLYG